MSYFYFVIHTTEEALHIIKRGSLQGAEFAARIVHRTDHYGERQDFNVIGPFQTEAEALQEIQKRNLIYNKPDRSERVLRELEKMLKAGEFTSNKQLENEIEELIIYISVGRVNLKDYRKADSRTRFGEIVDVIQEAIRRLEERFRGEKID